MPHNLPPTTHIGIEANGLWASQLLLGLPLFLWAAYRFPKQQTTIISTDPSILQTADYLGFSTTRTAKPTHIQHFFPIDRPFLHSQRIDTWLHPSPKAQNLYEQIRITSMENLLFARDLARGMLPNNPYLIPLISIRQQLPIQLLILDCDGVLTDGHISLSSSGEIRRRYSIHDGASLIALQKAGISIAILSAAQRDPSMVRRMDMLGIPPQAQHYGISNKGQRIQQLILEFEIPAWECAYIGDDRIDVEAMQWVGHPFCPANAAPILVRSGAMPLVCHGGNGCIREVADLILQQRRA